MKLHLPLSLLSSLLACMAAVSSPHAVAETYTWLGGTVDVHLNTNWTPDYGSSNWSATWAGTATNSMRFDAGSMTGQIKALQASFNTLSLGLFGKLFDTGLYQADLRIVVGKLVAVKGPRLAPPA